MSLNQPENPDGESQRLNDLIDDMEQTTYDNDQNFMGDVYIRDSWNNIKNNPLGRRDFAPPEGADKISPEQNLTSVVSLYGAGKLDNRE